MLVRFLLPGRSLSCQASYYGVSNFVSERSQAGTFGRNSSTTTQRDDCCELTSQHATMICQSCRRSIITNLRSIQRRGVATVPSTPNAAPSHPPPSTTTSQTPATSSATPGISQPLSTPFFPSTSDVSKSNSGNKELKRTKLQGSIPGGSELKGLGYLRAQPQVLAKEDDEYPAWLWTLLNDPKTEAGVSAVDLAAMTKKQRAKHDRRQERLMKNVQKPIPVHEQSRDLTTADDSPITSLERRQEVTKSSRQARRKEIRESNFLKGM